MSSFMSAFAAFAIRASGAKKRYADLVRRAAYVENLRKKNQKPFRLPPFPYRAKTEIQTTDGVEVLYFNRSREKKLIYLHGGAYCEPPLPPHLWQPDKPALDDRVLRHPRKPATRRPYLQGEMRKGRCGA